jgi:hypothetical protein
MSTYVCYPHTPTTDRQTRFALGLSLGLGPTEAARVLDVIHESAPSSASDAVGASTSWRLCSLVRAGSAYQKPQDLAGGPLQRHQAIACASRRRRAQGARDRRRRRQARGRDDSGGIRRLPGGREGKARKRGEASLMPRRLRFGSTRRRRSTMARPRLRRCTTGPSRTLP